MQCKTQFSTTDLLVCHPSYNPPSPLLSSLILSPPHTNRLLLLLPLLLFLCVVEGGGVVALAAARSVIDMDPRPTVIVLSGANVDNDKLLQVLNKSE